MDLSCGRHASPSCLAEGEALLLTTIPTPFTQLGGLCTNDLFDFSFLTDVEEASDALLRETSTTRERK